MLRRTICTVTVLLVSVGSADGAAKKIKFFTPTQAQLDESAAILGPGAHPDGMAILNYAQGAEKTIVNVIASDMTPFASYHIRLTDGVNEVVVLDAITTDDEGHGTYHEQFQDMNVSGYDVELFVGATASAVVWPQAPDQSVPQPTSMDRTGLPPLASTSRIADDFDLAAGQAVSKVRWWGGTCGTPALNEFRIQFLDKVGNAPGSVLQSITTGPLNSTASGETLDCGFAEQVFEFDITPAFAPAPGTYFISVAAIDDDADSPNFVWTGASSGGNAYVGTSNDQTEPTISAPLGHEVAFELIGESDTTEVRSSGVNPG